MEPALPQVRAHRGRRDGQVPPARRPGDLRRHGPHGAGLLDASAADRRAGQFRLDGRRSPGGDALHRGPPDPRGARDARRHRARDGRFPPQLRRERSRAGNPAGEDSQPAGQRRRRDRGRHGDQRAAAQSRRGRRCLPRGARRSRHPDRRFDRHRAGTRFPHRRHRARPVRDPVRLPSRPGLGGDARAHPCRADRQEPRGDRGHRDPVPGEQGADDREDRRPGAREADRGDFRSARRVRSRGRPGGDRAAPRRHGRDRAQPALPVLAASVDLRGQHAGARPGQAAADGPEGHAVRLHRVPRGGDPPAHRLRAQEGPGTRPRAGRARRGGRQYRRDDRADPRRARSRPGARSAHGAAMAGGGHRADHRASRRAGRRRGGRQVLPVRSPGAGHPGAPPAAPDRAGARQDRRGAEIALGQDRRISGRSWIRATG